MSEPDPDREAMPPPASPASRNRSSRPISSSNQTESSSSAISKSTSSGQSRVSPAMSDTSSDYPKSDQFSVATKLEIKRLSGHRCWACNTLHPQVAHVVGKEDQQVGLWHDAGLLNFQVTSSANGVPLCCTCHVEFDRSQDPGFVFIPLDLQYFIDSELENRKKRSSAVRDVPTDVMYRKHLVEKGIISNEAASGLYRPIFLKQYLLGGHASPEQFGFTEPKEWHGAPLATLRRGILALGSARICKVDSKTVSQLETLRNLYFRADAECSPEAGNRQTEQDLQSRKGQTDDDTNSRSKKRMKTKDLRKMSEPGNTGGHYLRSAQTYSCAPFRLQQDEWTLGPQFTTEQIVQRYADVLTHN